jgi:hypothetical protein
MSITPLLILAATMEHDSRPDEQSLLMVTIGVVSGYEARNIAILAFI